MVVVYGIESKLNPIKAELSRVIQQCMTDVFELPESKKAQRFIPLDPSNFYYPEGRSDAYTVIEINLMKGRKRDTQKALIKRLFVELERELSLAPIDVEITIKEQAPYQWGFRGMTGDEVQDLSYNIEV